MTYQRDGKPGDGRGTGASGLEMVVSDPGAVAVISQEELTLKELLDPGVIKRETARSRRAQQVLKKAEKGITDIRIDIEHYLSRHGYSLTKHLRAAIFGEGDKGDDGKLAGRGSLNGEDCEEEPPTRFEHFKLAGKMALSYLPVVSYLTRKAGLLPLDQQLERLNSYALERQEDLHDYLHGDNGLSTHLQEVTAAIASNGKRITRLKQEEKEAQEREGQAREGFEAFKAQVQKITGRAYEDLERATDLSIEESQLRDQGFEKYHRLKKEEIMLSQIRTTKEALGNLMLQGITTREAMLVYLVMGIGIEAQIKSTQGENQAVHKSIAELSRAHAILTDTADASQKSAEIREKVLSRVSDTALQMALTYGSLGSGTVNRQALMKSRSELHKAITMVVEDYGVTLPEDVRLQLEKAVTAGYKELGSGASQQ